MAIFAGIAVGLYMTQTGQADDWFPVLGLAAVFGNGPSFLLIEKAQKIKTVSGWRSLFPCSLGGRYVENVASSRFFSGLTGLCTVRPTLLVSTLCSSRLAAVCRRHGLGHPPICGLVSSSINAAFAIRLTCCATSY